MKSNLQKNLDILSNIALIICCTLFILFLIKNSFLSNFKAEFNTETYPTANDKRLPNFNAKPTSFTSVGKQLSNLNVDWAKNQQTLLIVLQKGCRFCDDSIPFYQRLVNELSYQSKTKIIAVLPQNIDEGKNYLKSKKLEIPNVIQADTEQVGARGTPTLLLIDNSGIVLEQWTGKLPNSDIEESVIQRIKQ